MGWAERANPNSLYNKKRRGEFDKPALIAVPTINEPRIVFEFSWIKIKDWLWQMLQKLLRIQK